jgi:outer membrane autotransporter protein
MKDPVIVDDRTWRLWISGLGGTTSYQGPAADNAQLDTRTAGVAVGLDYQLTPSTLIGVAGGYTNSSFSANEFVTNGTVEGGHVGLYGVQQFGPFYLAGEAQYAHYYNQTDRLIAYFVPERAMGNFESDAWSGRVEAGWQWWYDCCVKITPFAGFEAANLHSGSFVENSKMLSGGPGVLGLSFNSSSVNSLESSLGFQVDTRLPLPDGQTLIPFTRVAWVHQFDPDSNVSAVLTQVPALAFSSNAAFISNDVARVDAGVKLDVTGNISLFAYFDGEFSGQTKNYAGNGGLLIRW